MKIIKDYLKAKWFGRENIPLCIAEKLRWCILDMQSILSFSQPFCWDQNWDFSGKQRPKLRYSRESEHKFLLNNLPMLQWHIIPLTSLHSSAQFPIHELHLFSFRPLTHWGKYEKKNLKDWPQKSKSYC